MIESLIALALVLVIGGVALTHLAWGATASRVQPEALDMQQRGRVASERLVAVLSMAGAGLDAGPQTGALVHFLPPILPRRVGLSGDAFDVARPDALTVISVPDGAPQSRLAAPFTSDASPLVIDAMPGCPAGSQACGLEEGMTALVFDRAGRFDLFAILGVDGPAATVAALQPDGESRDAADAVAQVDVYTYYFDPTARQLRRYDGYKSDLPVVDDVVGVGFAYFGVPQPPDLPRPPPGIPNCLYDETGTSIGGMGLLSPRDGSLAPLPVEIFRDGPWCGQGANRYDADLLRIRRVRVSLRLQVAPEAFRASGPEFAVAGSSRHAWRYLPDVSFRFDVSPRNLNLGR